MATVKQVRIEGDRLVGFTMETPYLRECALCGQRELTELGKDYFNIKTT